MAIKTINDRVDEWRNEVLLLLQRRLSWAVYNAATDVRMASLSVGSTVEVIVCTSDESWGAHQCIRVYYGVDTFGRRIYKNFEVGEDEDAECVVDRAVDFVETLGKHARISSMFFL